MEKLTPGCNEEGWSMTVQCIGDIESDGKGAVRGCGARLRITKEDLYTTLYYGMPIYGTRVRFTCLCGVGNELPLPESKLFTDLPTKDEWLAKQTAPQE